MTDRGTLIQRKVQADTIVKFDGTEEKFENFKHQFRIQLGFRQLGYLLDPRFIKVWEATDNKYDPTIAETLAPQERYVDQIRQDNSTLFNLIGMSLSGSPVSYLVSAVLDHGQPQDGIAMWQELLRRF